MSKTILIVVCLIALSSAAFGQSQEPIPFFPSNGTPVYQERTLNALTIYIVGGSTTSAATYTVTGSTGITLYTTGGLYPGTTTFEFASSDADTYTDLIETLRALETTVPGAEGGVVVEYADTDDDLTTAGVYRDDTTTRLANVGNTGCLGSANEQTLTASDTSGVTIIFSRDDVDPFEKYYFTDLSCRLTFSSGEGRIDVYDGTTSTDTQRRGESFAVSGVDAQMDIPVNGNFHSTFKNTSLGTGGTIRFDVYGTSNVSAGWVNISFYKMR